MKIAALLLVTVIGWLPTIEQAEKTAHDMCGAFEGRAPIPFKEVDVPENMGGKAKVYEGLGTGVFLFDRDVARVFGDWIERFDFKQDGMTMEGAYRLTSKGRETFCHSSPGAVSWLATRSAS